MNRTKLLALIAVGSMTLAACDNPKGEAQAARDSAAGQESAAVSAAKAQQRADARIASDRADAHDEQNGESSAAAGAQEEYARALAQCEGLGGAMQRSCKEQANADYGVTRARIQKSQAGSAPRP